MELIWTTIIFLLINLVNTEKFRISVDDSSSTEARQLCKLAEPELSYEGGRTVKLAKTDIEGNIENNDSFWIGYMREYAAFLYRGCVAASTIQREPNWTLSRSPGLCYSFCRGQFIGIEAQKCYCFPSIPVSVTSGACDRACGFPNDTSCGGDEGYITLYERVNYPESNGNENGYCRAYMLQSGKFFWAECNEEYGAMCTEDQESTDTDDYEMRQHKDDWLASNNYCLEEGDYPVKEQVGFMPTGNPKKEVWTGSIRTFIFTPVTDNNGTIDGFKQGYIQYDAEKDAFMLRFNQQNVIRPTLCQTGNEAPSTDTSSTSSVQASTTTAFRNGMTSEYTDKPTSTGSSTNDLSHSNRATESTDSPGPVSPQYRKDTSTKEEESNLVGVYVAVPLVLVLIVVVTGLFLWRKRNRRSSANAPKDNKTITNGTKPTDGLGNGISNAAYQDDFPIGTHLETVEHSYQILEPASEYSSIDDTVQTSGEYAYDTTKTGVVKGNVVSDNIYNRFDDEVEDTYNHTNIANSRNDETYNHAEVRNAIDAPVDSNSNARLPHFSPNDTYSHLAGTSVNDNNSLANLKNPSPVDVEDTYNHTGPIQHIQKPSLNSNGNSKPIAKLSDPKSDNGTQGYDYAFVTKGDQRGASKPSGFTFSQSPTPGDYEFAQETNGYELAKPMPI